MKLKDLLREVNYKEIYGNTDVDVKNISINSKDVKKGSLFIAVKGFKYDGHDFIDEAISGGASGVVVHKKEKISSPVTQVIVNNTREILPEVCRNFYKNPTGSFKLIGVTGTNGKTTTCYIIDSILRSAGIKSSLITTVQSFIGGYEVFFSRTTPESLDLNDFFYKSKNRKVQTACMEVSSHAVDLHRIDYLNFEYLIFTNLSQDHLDYHKDMRNYFSTKKKLFLKENRSLYGGKKAIINIDDFYGKEIFRDTDLDKLSYSLEPGEADIWPTGIKNSISGIKMTINTSRGLKFDISSPLCGYFNVYNIMAAVGVCMDMGIDTYYIKEGVSSMRGVRGRFEKVYSGTGISVIVDYAHTPDGLENVLKTARQVLQENGRIISVFGCGGDRDKGKRKIMGEISGRYADYTIITSDNPRSEKPGSIIGMIEKGITSVNNRGYARETDRKKAIFNALEMAAKGDMVIIAGKGHEDYQEFKDYKIPFCDWEVVEEWVKQKK
jgi:UDP-N-acetylmuramoyl-L-alanyl-D-glutamate--2,6-diaminopimelate ligase